LESAAFFGVALALRDYDESKGHIRAYVAARARGEVMSEIRDRHPNGGQRGGGLRTHCSGIGQEETGVLEGASAAEPPDPHSVPDLIRQIRQQHSPMDAALVALALETGSYDETARAMGISTNRVYQRLRLIRRGPIGRALAHRFGLTVTPTGALERR
jgi:DNA-directed RNA polymerase specialized sigma24 family protein